MKAFKIRKEDVITRTYPKTDIPKGKSLSFKQGSIVYGTIGLVGISIGAALATYILVGSVMLVGVAVVIQNTPTIKRMVIKSTKTLDMIFLISTVYATATLGITVAASLTFAGLGLTLVYFPALREGLI